MTDSDRMSRRTMLMITGAAGMTALAGCGGSDNGDGNGGGNGDENGAADADWESVEEFYFNGQISHWGAEEPAFLEGEENPTITLIEGQEYTFRWYNNDGVQHNMEIRNEDDDVVEDYQSDDVSEEGEEASIEGVTATQEMATYICQYHETTQVGDIEVQSE
ncbi:PKD domain-containing protein [Halosolutus amylolyticus]|uniref:PKD domain-containing protein n=1 Tax=Halosolutus amylolyticus TaxID=2932267 RepID=A0ABD5PM07_9EURY|nr:PKD domain-containing protein [Halosolutus amylolyticus]